MKLDSILRPALAASLLALVPLGAFASGSVNSPQGCQHPAVSVARHGVPADPSARFYLHPARLSWSLTRPMEEGEHPAVLVAHRPSDAPIDPNRFIPAHPAGGSGSTER